MSNEIYERYQLELIVQEYREKGFEIFLEDKPGFSNLRFDAVAKHKESGKLVFIELVNKPRTKAQTRARIRAIERLSRHYPEAVVDFRYIDIESSRFRKWQENIGENYRIEVVEAISQRAPRPPLNSIGISVYFMQIWSLHVTTIRSFGRHLNLQNDRGALDIYNELLRLEILSPPEDRLDDVFLNLFELHEAVLAIADGATVQDYYLDNLINHFRSVRQQVRRFLRLELGSSRNRGNLK